jgi:hypothetical protein
MEGHLTSRVVRAFFLLGCLSSAALSHATPQDVEIVRLVLSGISADDLDGLDVVRWNGGAHQRVAGTPGADGNATWLDVATACQPATTFVVTTRTQIGAVTMPGKCAESERVRDDECGRRRPHGLRRVFLTPEA